MSKRLLLYAALIMTLVISPIFAEGPAEEILLQAVHKDTPFVKRKNDQEFGPETTIKMVNVHGNPHIKSAPPGDTAVLYYGEVKLGYPQQTYGMLIDFESQDKTVWPDSNSDQEFAGENSYGIFKSDRYTGGNIYYSPMPITFRINYVFNGHDFPREIQMDLPYLIIYRAGSGDCFSLKTRTWFIGTFVGKKGEQQIAIVDANDNGVFNDPDDMVFVDQDFDLAFAPKEGRKIKSFNKLQLKEGDFKVDFSMCPVKLLLSKG